MRSLRVGLVCPYSFDAPGGVQNHVLGLARQLFDAGHLPYVLAPGDLGATGADLVAPEAFTSAGAAFPLRYNGSVARVNFGPVVAGRVGRWMRRRRLDLVHIHEPITPSISLLALWAADVPVVATFHTATPRSRSMRLAGGVLRQSIDKIAAGIAVSESARNVVVQHLGRDAVVIPNGFRYADFAGPVAGRTVREGRLRPRLVFLGRLDEPRKGLDVLLAAVPAIQAAAGPVEVIVAGRGGRTLPSWCRSLGEISDQAKAALLATADVFVAPHLERESFGIVLLEAMASGAPVVASALPAFTDVLATDAQTERLGEVFRVGDPAALAAAAVGLLRRADPARVRRAQEASRRYDWSVVGEEILGVYAATLNAAPRSPEPVLRRVERTWAALDAALVRRARRAAELADAPGADPVAAGMIAGAAAAALEPDLSWHERERAESALTHALAAAGDRLPHGWDHLRAEHHHTGLSRRLHNDAVAAARALDRGGATRRYDPPRTGGAALRTRSARLDAKPFEMADDRELIWPDDR